MYFIIVIPLCICVTFVCQRSASVLLDTWDKRVRGQRKEYDGQRLVEMLDSWLENDARARRR